MRPLDFKPTNPSYYCSTARWDQRRDEVAEFDCWGDFKDDWCPKGITYDDDLQIEMGHKWLIVDLCTECFDELYVLVSGYCKKEDA